MVEGAAKTGELLMRRGVEDEGDEEEGVRLETAVGRRAAGLRELAQAREAGHQLWTAALDIAQATRGSQGFL